MSWKTSHRSFYYENAAPPDDIVLNAGTTALSVIDIQNTYLELPDDAQEAQRWQPFFTRINELVIPITAKLIDDCRRQSVEVIFTDQCASSTVRSLADESFGGG